MQDNKPFGGSFSVSIYWQVFWNLCPFTIPHQQLRAYLVGLFYTAVRDHLNLRHFVLHPVQKNAPMLFNV